MNVIDGQLTFPARFKIPLPLASDASDDEYLLPGQSESRQSQPSSTTTQRVSKITQTYLEQVDTNLLIVGHRHPSDQTAHICAQSMFTGPEADEADAGPVDGEDDDGEDVQKKKTKKRKGKGKKELVRKCGTGEDDGVAQIAAGVDQVVLDASKEEKAKAAKIAKAVAAAEAKEACEEARKAKRLAVVSSLHAEPICCKLPLNNTFTLPGIFHRWLEDRSARLEHPLRLQPLSQYVLKLRLALVPLGPRLHLI